MKYLLTAAALAIVTAAAPAGAQVAYGMSPGATPSAVEFSSGGNWRDAVVIYASGNTGSSVIDNAIAPLSTDAGAATPAGVTFDVQSGAAVGLAGFGGTDALAPLPEPATWVMMMLGFGAVGGVLRSRRKAMLRHA